MRSRAYLNGLLAGCLMGAALGFLVVSRRTGSGRSVKQKQMGQKARRVLQNVSRGLSSRWNH